MIKQEPVPVKPNILVVDDIPANLHLFAKMLSQEGYKVRSAVTGALAISGAKAMPPDLILLDILMPELDGYQVCALLKADPLTQDIPIIFISALGEEIDKVRAFEVGAVDYVTKPFLKSEVLARIDYHIRASQTQKQLLTQNLRLQEEIEYRRLMEAKLERFSVHLKQIHRLNTSQYRTIEALFRDYLQTGCSIFGCSVGLMGHLEGGLYVIDALESTFDNISPSWELRVQDTDLDWVVRRQKTVTHEEMDRGLRSFKPLNLGCCLLKSFMGTPIWVQDELYGILIFGSTHDRLERFDTQAQDIVELMAQGLGKWIGIRQTALKQKQAEEETQLLLKVTQAISRSPDFDSALQSALEHLCEASGWSYGEVWLPSPDGQTLTLSPPWYCHKQEPPEVLSHLERFRYGRQEQIWSSGTGLLGNVWATGKAEYVPDVPQRSPEICQQLDLAALCHIQQGLWIPILSVSGDQQQEQVVAVLVLFLSGISTLEFHHQSHQLLAFASAIASQLGTILHQKQIEAEQRAMLMAMDDLIMVYNQEGICLKFMTNNPLFLQEPPENKLHKSLYDCLPQAEADEHLRAIRQAIATGETQTLQYHLNIGDRRMWFSGKISPLSHQTILLVVRDITPLETITTALQQSEARFRAIFEQAGIGIYITTLEGHILQTNAAFESFLGYPSTELQNRPIQDMVYADDNLDDPNFQNLLLGRIQSYQVEKRYLHHNGQIRWGRVTLSPVQEHQKIQFIFALVEDITETRKIEWEIKESERRYRELIEVQKDVLICRWKPNTELTFVNQYFCQFFHQNAGDLISKKLNSWLVDSQSIQDLENNILELLTTLNPKTWEYEYRSGTGEHRWLRWTNQPIVDRWGILVDIQSFGVDITAQKQRELALKLISQGIASATGNSFFESCTQYLADILQVKYALLAKLSDSQFHQVDILAFWNGKEVQKIDQFETINAPCDRLLSGESVYYPDNLQNEFEDHPLIIQLNAQSFLGIPLKNTHQKIIGYLAILDTKPLNIDAQKQVILDIFVARSEAELERIISQTQLEKIARQERSVSRILSHIQQILDLDRTFKLTTDEIRNLFDSDRVAIYQLNSDFSGQFIADSFAAEWTSLFDLQNQISWSSELIIDESCAIKHWLDTPSQCPYPLKCISLEPSDRQGQYLCMTDIYQAGFEVEYLKFVEKMQARSYLIIPLFSSHKLWGLLGIYQNRSAREWQENEIKIALYITNCLSIAIQQWQLVDQIQKKSEELKIAKENADASNRAKSAFLAKMSHEFRTPLNAILGFAQVMGRDGSLSGTQQEQLKIINQSGEHLLNLINDVLEMSRIESGKVDLNATDFDLVKVLENLKSILQLKARLKGLELKIKLDERVNQYVYGDEKKLGQVLINLVDNGIKFSSQGSVTLEVMRSDTSANHLDQYKVKFKVIDTGIGIAPENIETLFKPFVQSKGLVPLSDFCHNDQEGTGLGLAISQHFVELMGGQLRVDSTVGLGSTFFFEIPLPLGQAESIISHRPQQTITGLAPDQPIYRILVVDDERDQRLLMLHLLTHVGFEVQAAENGQEAIALWQSWQPHLILMDMRMPILNGLDATHQIKSTIQGQATVVMALTAHAFEEDRKQILAAGCDDFISKPFQEQLLLEKIAHYLGARYLYETYSLESTLEPVETPDSAARIPSTSLPWLTLSTERLLALHQSAIEADQESIFDLSAEIENPQITEWLLKRIHHFEFEAICEAIAPFLPRTP